MKKFFILLVAVALTAISADVWAQDSGTTPTQGSTHNYSVTVNGTNTYAWYTTKGGLTGIQNEDVTFDPAAANTASVDITWATDADVTESYYLHVVETDATTGCTNEKVMKVDPIESQFYLAITSVLTPEACYYNNPVTVGLDGSGLPTYDHGTATVSYTITPTGLVGASGGYSFDLDSVFTLNGITGATPTVTTGNGSVADLTVTVTDNSPVTVEFVLTNTNVETNVTDPLGTRADFTTTVSISNGETGNGVLDNGGGDYSDSTIITRPHTTSIVTD